MTDDASTATADHRGRYGSRKWLLALLLVALSTGLRWAELIDSSDWVQTVTWVAGLYMAGNAGTAWAAAFTGRRP